MAKRNRAVDLITAQQGALAYAQEWLGANVIPLPPGVDDDAFGKIMDTITRGLVQAYVSGYVKAAEA